MVTGGENELPQNRKTISDHGSENRIRVRGCACNLYCVMNLDEIIEEESIFLVVEDHKISRRSITVKDAKIFMREAVKQALELAAERAECKLENVIVSETEYSIATKKEWVVNKQSILSIIDEIE